MSVLILNCDPELFRNAYDERDRSSGKLCVCVCVFVCSLCLSSGCFYVVTQSCFWMCMMREMSREEIRRVFFFNLFLRVVSFDGVC